ncbi:MAG: twin-arginine translocase subunit TatC [Candidatus Taylorbacteria bacterium]
METFKEKFSGYSEYFEHMRKKLFSTAIFFAVSFVCGFFEAGNILKGIISIFNLGDVSIVTTSPFQFLDLSTKVGLYSGIIVCIPVVIYHIYDFIKDGLNKDEKKLFFILLPSGFTLFLIGFSYCVGILFFYLNSISTINLAFGIKNVWDISSFMSQIIIASLCLGLFFQFPIVLTFLIRMGLLSVDFLRDKRFYAIAMIFIFVGFLPPPDIFSTLIEALPLVLLYQLTIWINSSYRRTSDIIDVNHD